MSIKPEVYIKQETGKYVATKDDAIFPISWLRIVFKVLLQLFFIFMPSFVEEFIRAYIWTPKMAIKGSVALVTGGAFGFGRALCFCLAREGCNIAVADIDGRSAIRTASEIQKMGVEAMGFRVDVTDFISVQELRKQVAVKLGDVDILIDNAVVPANTKMSDDVNEELRGNIGENLVKHCWVISEFEPAIIQKTGSKIVGISPRFASTLQK